MFYQKLVNRNWLQLEIPYEAIHQLKPIGRRPRYTVSAYVELTVRECAAYEQEPGAEDQGRQWNLSTADRPSQKIDYGPFPEQIKRQFIEGYRTPESPIDFDVSHFGSCTFESHAGDLGNSASRPNQSFSVPGTRQNILEYGKTTYPILSGIPPASPDIQRHPGTIHSGSKPQNTRCPFASALVIVG
jgi:hypothetical protein